MLLILTYLLTYLLTYSLTPWSTVLPEKLTDLQLVKKFPAIYGTAFTSARHLSISWASSIHSIPHSTFWRSILILSSHLLLGLPIGLLPSGFPNKTLYTSLPSPYALHVPPISFFSILTLGQYLVSSTDLHCWCYKSYWLQQIICLTVGRYRGSKITLPKYRSAAATLSQFARKCLSFITFLGTITPGL